MRVLSILGWLGKLRSQLGRNRCDCLLEAWYSVMPSPINSCQPFFPLPSFSCDGFLNATGDIAFSLQFTETYELRKSVAGVLHTH
ncbi:uncharacterized protein B0T15DRAFT_535594 [Chaetomium strumarium]|uniref:Uncharacterized protein n=1 Tax=Chaetomium strumarium TaxID=1170767 RepID=A0AAJ0GQ74_9PEZI|nr:hypothetical protein B0T15DRAFT_535594 [Chaetomium strumarium]